MAWCLKKRAMIWQHTRKKPLGHIQEVVLPLYWNQNFVYSRHWRVVGTQKLREITPIKGKSTQKCFPMNSENLNMSGEKEVQLNLSIGYLITLKSPNKHYVKLHLNLTVLSSTHRASLRLTSVGPYTPEQTHSNPFVTPFNNTKIENLPTTQSTFSNILLSQIDNTPPVVWLASKATHTTKGLPHRFITPVEWILSNFVSCRQTTSHFHSASKFFAITLFWGLFNPLTFQDKSFKFMNNDPSQWILNFLEYFFQIDHHN